MVRLACGDSLGGRYALIRPLGRGDGVWLCRDTTSDETVVVKVVARASGAERVELLRREWAAARRLTHPHVARVLEFREDGDWAFVTSEWVEGDDLSGWLGRSVPEALDVLVPVADALAHAHAAGIVHRDLKPSNVVLGRDGSARLVDFGIAGTTGDDADVVRGGGTRSWASPEQLAGAPPSPADDVHAFGALLHAALAGHVLPEALAALVERMLAREREARPQSMAEVRDALGAIRRALDAGERRSPRTVRLAPPPRVAPVAPHRQAGAHAPERPARTMLWTAVTLAAAALALWGISLVPRAVAPPVAPPVAPAPATEPVAEPAAPAGASRVRLDAGGEEALARALAALGRLEERAVAEWAPDGHSRAVDELSRGDTLLGQGDPQAAARLYASAARGLAALEDELPARVTVLVEAGHAALDDGRVDEARRSIELAQRIAPERPDTSAAVARLARAAEHETALAQGGEHESDGDLAAAERAYARAVASDPRSSRAREALARVRAAVVEQGWVRSMTEGLAALERGEHERARDAFREAAALKPDAPGAADGRARAEAGIELDAIARHAEQARAAEAHEAWPQAVEHYGAVLALDPTILSAQQGLERSRERAELARSMAFHLAHPERLVADEVYAEARALAGKAQAVEPAGVLHRGLAERLAALVERAGRFVPVVLLSDGRTEVTMYRVGRLGAFERRELTLRPGTYTVVGSRSGYRDVRHELVVDAEVSPSLDVRCVDKI